jgi:predicted nucleic acid-binding protein
MMKPSLYLETTIPSFLVGTISPVLATAVHQAATIRWWKEKREDYEVFISSVVIEEIQKGKTDLSKERLKLVADLPRLELSPDVKKLAESLKKKLVLPTRAETDIVHVAIACHYAMDYMLSWNMKHIVNGQVIRDLTHYCDETQTSMPIICTPYELLERNEES